MSLVRPMTLKAGVRQDWPDITTELDLRSTGETGATDYDGTTASDLKNPQHHA